jgi:hypothetical protein
MRTGTALRAGAAVLAAVALTACSGSDPQAGHVTDSPTPSSTSASPSPSATTPEQQVEAAVRAYYAELTRAAQTQDTSVLATLSTHGCSCFNVVGGIKALAAKGQTTPDAAWHVDSIRVHDVSDELGQAEVKYSVSRYQVLRPDGSVVRTFDADTAHVDLSLVHSDGAWIIGDRFDLER